MEKKKFEILKNILFGEDIRQQRQLTEKVVEVDDILNDKEKLETKISPILQDHVQYLEDNFPSLFGAAITASIKKQILESQDEVVDALYPIIGKMIKKYISRELEILSEKIDLQLQKAFSWKGWVLRIKAWFGGVSEKEMMMKQLVSPEVEEVLVIQQDSGLLIGSYSRHNTIDRDMIAGMLTAIKSFVRDAFSGGNEELQTIEYENYKVIINNLKSFYVALVITGFMDTEFKEELDDILVEFEKEVLDSYSQHRSDFTEEQLTSIIQKHFSKLNNG